jgi:hypothetical protein
MKSSSIAAALIVLALTAHVHAQRFSRIEYVAQDGAALEGPAIRLPHPPPEPTSVMRTRSTFAADEQPAAAPETLEAPGVYGGYPDAGGNYGYQGRWGNSYALGNSCCQATTPEAMGLWDNYCACKQCSKSHGWLAGKLRCGCCPPRHAMFAGWKHCGHGWKHSGCCEHAACGCAEPAPACDCQPACTSCGDHACGCCKPGGLLVSLFAAFKQRHACGCCEAPCGCANGSCADHAGHDWMPASDGEVIEPMAPLPAPPAEEPAASENKAARRGLLPTGFRLFPALSR